MKYQLNHREVTYALSEALDYVGIDDTMHGKRVGYMSAEVAKRLGWDSERIDRIILMGMLHDCGVSSTDVHHHLVTELDWDNSQVHCLRGASLLSKVPFYTDYAEVILYHHTHWNQLPDSLPKEVKEEANLIYLTDRVDALRVQLGSTTLHDKANVRTTIQKYISEMFSEELTAAFVAAAEADSFWYYLEAESLEGYYEDWIRQSEPMAIDFSELKSIAMMFADVVDAKSPFTSKHTYGVASLARYLAELYGLSEAQQECIELSAFFHDLGKLRVADAILHKAGPLDEEERAQMNRHGFDSNVILRKIKGFHEIAKIAAMHHETLDAKGYPYHLGGDQIPIEARILSVADIFQALVQDRPYRIGLHAEEAQTILNAMSNDLKLDSAIVNIVAQNLGISYTKAMYAE
ncbi:MAG: HD domain-containing protein [Sulfuricurvum sp.]|uniref:HD-GYP domain-containing protein n=1 Tax=Sulfuricurvum sp. TaxID=2025608 RepID=UPI0025E38E08|nr:HD domain-containing phosphohydrolase [Sulfuricurvum sp.]MBV5321127.1 HD domain-containing protein [Sulfuricurvum sp.]